MLPKRTRLSCGVLTRSSFGLVPSCPLSERGRGGGWDRVSWMWRLLPTPMLSLARERCRRQPGDTTRHSSEEEGLVLKWRARPLVLVGWPCVAWPRQEGGEARSKSLLQADVLESRCRESALERHRAFCK